MMNHRTIATTLFMAAMTAQSLAQTSLYDAGWRFHRGGAQGAETPSFADSGWRHVDLPHDWSIEDLPGTQSPFDPNAISQVSGGFTVGGTGWYRKTFEVPADVRGRRVHLQFDGVYMNADFWLNGEHIGNHPYGYTSFWFDITENVRFGETNVLAVQVKNEGQNSRWYSGSGIYRHVWLRVLAPVHIGPWGVYVATPEVSASRASVRVKVSVINTTADAVDAKLITRLLTKSGEVARVEASQRIAGELARQFKGRTSASDIALFGRMLVEPEKGCAGTSFR
jgi:beta-galactosidase